MSERPNTLNSIHERLASARGAEYWRCLEELADTEEFRELLQREYPRQASAWDESLVGRILYPATTDTAFAVMAVTAPDRMILSRPYSGGTALTSVGYSVSAEDVFALLFPPEHNRVGQWIGEPKRQSAGEFLL